MLMFSTVPESDWLTGGVQLFLFLLIFAAGVVLLRWILGINTLAKNQAETNRLLTEIKDRLGPPK